MAARQFHPSSPTPTQMVAAEVEGRHLRADSHPVLVDRPALRVGWVGLTHAHRSQCQPLSSCPGALAKTFPAWLSLVSALNCCRFGPSVAPCSRWARGVYAAGLGREYQLPEWLLPVDQEITHRDRIAGLCMINFLAGIMFSSE